MPTMSKGTPGAAGAAGSPGTIWRHGSGAPSNSLGVDGDFYVDTVTDFYYQRASGVYTQVGALKGDTGAAGATGATGAAGSSPVVTFGTGSRC